MGHSHPMKEVSHNSVELSAQVSTLTVGARIVELIVIVMGAFIKVATMFHSLCHGIELIYVDSQSGSEISWEHGGRHQRSLPMI